MSRFGPSPVRIVPRASGVGPILFLLACALLFAPTAAGQDRALILGGVAPSATRAEAPEKADGFVAAGAEPRELAGMLQHQNEIRHRSGASALSWSNALAQEVRETIEAAAEPVCSQSGVRRAVTDKDYAWRWVAPLRRTDGTSIPRSVSAPYIVSEWTSGAGDYDAAKATCRRGGDCDSYRPMIAPEARLVGCARVSCSTGAQVVACGYAPRLKPR